MSEFRHLDELLMSFVERGLPGCAAAVAKDGDIVYESYHGMADIEENRPITEDTVYRLYSMTKVIICTVALMLAERGRFLLNDPIYEYLPEYKRHVVSKAMPDGKFTYEESKGPMLIKHAFTMSVGLPYPGEDNPTAEAIRKIQAELGENYSLMEFVRLLGGVPIACEPGELFMYGYGHDIVAALVEAVSGKTVGEFLKEELFEALGMNSTGYRFFGGAKERMASVYKMEDGKPPAKIQLATDRWLEQDAKYEGGGSGLISTVRDYLKFTRMLANGGMHKNKRIIGRKTIDLMRQNQLAGEPLKKFWNFYNAGYGYGLGVRTMLDTALAGANNSFGAFGWSGLLGTWTEIDLSERLSMVYMHQTMPNMEEYHHLRVRAAVYGGIMD